MKESDGCDPPDRGRHGGQACAGGGKLLGARPARLAFHPVSPQPFLGSTPAPGLRLLLHAVGSALRPCASSTPPVPSAAVRPERPAAPPAPPPHLPELRRGSIAGVAYAVSSTLARPSLTPPAAGPPQRLRHLPNSSDPCASSTPPVLK
ncbi:hypothetical protein GUJ93_ZPchr0001g32767 [Zizania palustris]|uniref:Uncharacterized protein n=1 Tax=Zizania palustris TaxID=103762 RepID=A0A8J5S980_ZIZPA|nr:hypothetical protein GUJ93_ZPchr0001g32767 [Zizania palustris]